MGGHPWPDQPAPSAPAPTAQDARCTDPKDLPGEHNEDHSLDYGEGPYKSLTWAGGDTGPGRRRHRKPELLSHVEPLCERDGVFGRR
jgi:hypothetical protein